MKNEQKTKTFESDNTSKKRLVWSLQQVEHAQRLINGLQPSLRPEVDNIACQTLAQGVTFYLPQ